MMKKLLLYLLLFISVNISSQVPNYVPSDSLVGWWGFNGNANDESGNGNNGTVNGATLVADRFGNASSAYDFDGFDDYIISPSDSRYLNDTLTISFWFNLNTDPNLKEVICLGNSGSTRWGAIASVNYLDMNVGRGCSGCCSAFSVSNNSNTWLHAVLVLSGGSTDIYKNGALISTSTNSIPSSLGCNISDLYFGVDVFTSSYYLDLQLDDIGIWNRPLDSCEIKDLYDSSIGNCCTNNSITSQPTDQTVNMGNNATFTFTDSLTAATYQWQLDAGTGYTNLSNAGQFSGTDTETLTVSAVTMSNNNTNYRCLVAESSSCSDTTDVVNLTVSSGNSINEYDNATVKLYPNPTNGWVTLSLSKTSNGQVILTDLLGKEVLSKRFTSNEVQLNLKSLESKGTYFIKVLNSTGNVIAIKKLIYQ